MGRGGEGTLVAPLPGPGSRATRGGEDGGTGARLSEREGGSRWEYALTSGELGAAAAQTTIVVVLPLLLQKYAASNFWIGFAVGGEGVFALLVPFWVGYLSDKMPRGLARHFGRRMLFLLLAAPAMAAAMVIEPFLGSYWMMAGVAFVFFAALHTYLTPLWTLMLDSVPDERRGRVQGSRGIFRAAGLAYGLVAAGLLFSIGKLLPFLVGAALLLGTTGATWLAERRVGGDREEDGRRHVGLKQMWKQLKKHPAGIWLLVANAFWNGAIDGIRPYIFLYSTTVLGVTVAQTSEGLGILVIGIGIGSAVLGKLGDKLPRGRLLMVGTAVLAAAFSVATFLRHPLGAGIALGFGGLGAAGAVTITYPYFAELMGEGHQGEYTGLFVFSVGFGRIFSPMLVGAAIDLGKGFMPKVKGYPMMWPTVGVLAILGWLALWRTIVVARRHGHPDQAAEDRKG